MTHRLVALILLFALLLSGCAQIPSPYDQQSRADATAGPLALAPLGQTFRATADGLAALEIQLVGGRPSDGPLHLHLRASPDDRSDLRSAVVAHATLPLTGTYRWSFSPLWESDGRDYYLLIEQPAGTPGQGQAVSISAGDAYPSGELYRAGHPTGGDLVFTAYYDAGPLAALRYAAKMSVRYPAGLWALFFLLLVPGALIRRLLRLHHDDPLVRLSIAVGISIAVTPLALLLADTLGLRLGARLLRAPALVLTLLEVGLWLRERPWRQPGWRQGWLRSLPSIIILLIAAAVRLLHMRGLPGPQWVDGPQHAAELTLILRDGGLPDSYAPYAPGAHPIYHFGYHALAAGLVWLSGLSPPQALLLAGQALGATIPLACTALATSIGGRRAGGLVAALTVGCIFLLPAYFISWSTYTRVAGLALLPVACLLAQQWLDGARRTLGIAAAIVAAGLAITHYYVAVMYGAYVLATLISGTILRSGQQHGVLHRWGRAVALAAVSVALVLPWLLQIVSGPRIQEQLSFNNPGQGAAAGHHSQLLLYGKGGNLLLPRPPRPLDRLLGEERSLSWLLLSPVTAAVLLRLLRRDRHMPQLLLWLALIFIASLGRRRGLPLLIDRLGLYSMLSVPIACVFGAAAGPLLEDLRARLGPSTRRVVSGAALALLVWLAVAGARDLLLSRSTGTVLLAEPDLVAFEWARKHLPQEAVVLTNSFPWATRVVAGSDGGAWLTAMTGLRALPPPILYRFARADFIAHMRTIGELSYIPPPAEELWSRLRAEGITHIYIGWRITPAWTGAALRPDMLLQSEHFTPVYQREGVWIFAVNP